MNSYTHSFTVACPNNGARIDYTATIETVDRIMVEEIVAECAKLGADFHEDIADKLLARFGGVQTIKAHHHGVDIETRRGGRTLTGIGCVLSCAHPPVNEDIFGGETHGHSYEVVVWFDNATGLRDARICAAAVETIRKTLDHKMLSANLATGEAIARYFGLINNVVEVEVRRPLERYFARWIAA